MEKPPLNRRTFLSTLGAAAAAPLVARDYGPGALPVRYPEPDVKVLEPAFGKYKIGKAWIKDMPSVLQWFNVTADV